MVEAENFEEVAPGVFRWEAFSPEHRVELTSHAVLLENGLFCFDPIPLAASKMIALAARGAPTAIVLTNGNHERACRRWRDLWQVPVWVPEGTGFDDPGYRELPSGRPFWLGQWELHPLGGGARAETAFYCPGLSLMVVGDAIVNLPYRGLELLPAKYCVNRSLLEGNLRKASELSFDRLCMAHGQTMVRGASEAVRKLLG
jgi:glyoxylase-like metal-dependent hydrolase (beta-lactamase superfamily II)